MRNWNIYLVMILFAWLFSACSQVETTPVPAVEDPTAVPEAVTPTEAPTAVIPEPTEAPVNVDTGVVVESRLPLVDDFEDGALAAGMAEYAQVGYITWSDGSAVSITTVEAAAGDPLAVPGQAGSNTFLQLQTDIKSGGWAGFSNAFANPDQTAWVPQDWSPYKGVSLWLYGNGTGGTLFIDILDNRTAGSNLDDAERFTIDIMDDFEGWQYFELPFLDFRRKDIGNGAPNDGFTLTEVHGIAVGAFGSVVMGPQTNYVDDIILYGVADPRPVEVRVNKVYYTAREGGSTTVVLNLNKPSEEPVAVDLFMTEGKAAAGQDYQLPLETVVFEPGEMNYSFKIDILDDDIPEGTEQTVLMLANPQGAVLNPQARAVLTIRDDEPADPDLVYDFNEAPPFFTSGGFALTTLEVTPDSALALPGQTYDEHVLEIQPDPAGTAGEVYRRFAEGENWQDKTGISFWMYGTNSQDPVSVVLLDNQLTTTADVSPDEWGLVWSDEFNDPAGTRPNPGIWQPEIGDGLLNGLMGWGNSEFEYYTDQPENAAADGEGNLVITAREVDQASSKVLCWYGPCRYTSARLITWGRAEFMYGRIETRMQLPFGQGIWPAFWALGTNLDEVGWPVSGEVDIMENIGREPGTIHGTIHGPGYEGGNAIGAGYDLAEGRFADAFHVFAIEWQRDQIRWFMDGENFLTLTPDDLPAGADWVYNHPFFIIMNLAVGGNWPGAPNDTTIFPQTLRVDYVRVYGAENRSERFEYQILDDFEGWKEIVIPFEAFTRGQNQPEGAPDDGLNLNQVWGYGFEIPENRANPLYLDKFRIETTQP